MKESGGGEYNAGNEFGNVPFIPPEQLHASIGGEEVPHEITVPAIDPPVSELPLHKLTGNEHEALVLPRNFMVPHDGRQPQLSREATQAAADAFGELYGEVTRDNADAIRSYRACILGRTTVGRVLNLLLHAEPENVQYSVQLRKPTYRVPGIGHMRPEQIVLDEVSIMDKPSAPDAGYTLRLGDYVVYRRYGNGTVRRQTNISQGQAPMPTPEMDLRSLAAMTPDQIEAYVMQHKEAFLNWQRNRQLERDMRLNDQPVGPDEVAGLAAFLRQPRMCVFPVDM